MAASGEGGHLARIGDCHRAEIASLEDRQTALTRGSEGNLAKYATDLFYPSVSLSHSTFQQSRLSHLLLVALMRLSNNGSRSKHLLNQQKMSPALPVAYSPLTPPPLVPLFSRTPCFFSSSGAKSLTFARE